MPAAASGARADGPLAYYRVFGRTIAAVWPLRELPLCSPAVAGAPEWIVRDVAEIPLDRAVRWRMLWRQHGGEPWMMSAHDDGRYHFRFTRFCDFRVQAGEILTARRGFARRSTIEHLLIDQVVPLSLASSGRTVLHASAVADPACRARVLCGAAGVGKSTLAAALAQADFTPLADDGVLVQWEDGAARGVPSYPGLRLWPDSAAALGFLDDPLRPVAEYSSKRRVALRAHDAPSALDIDRIYVLERGPAPSLEPMTGHEAVLALLRHAFRADVGAKEGLVRQMHELGRLAAAVPIWRLRIPPDLRRIGRLVEAVARHA